MGWARSLSKLIAGIRPLLTGSFWGRTNPTLNAVDNGNKLVRLYAQRQVAK